MSEKKAIMNAPHPEMPAAPEGTQWDVHVKPGRTMPSEVTVFLKKEKWPHKIITKRSSQCGAFFDRPGDEGFFKSVTAGLARDCLDPPEDPELPYKWLREMGLA